MNFKISKIAIVGAGPTGLVAAKYLLAKKKFDSVVLYEQQPESALGGIWHYTPEAPRPPPAPQTDPYLPLDPPLPPRRNPDDEEDGPIFLTAMYDELHANIEGSLMQYDRGVPFPREARVFPTREVIRDYVVRYAEEVKHHIRFCREVVEVKGQMVDGFEKWNLTAKSTVTGEAEQETYDAVVVANGHYSLPYIPPVKGISHFQRAHPTIILHSKQYRTPKAFQNKTVMVVGNGPSGTDIAYQIRPYSMQTYLSVRSPTRPEKLAHTGCTEVPEIIEFLPDVKGVRLRDGTAIENLDAIIYCTGFLFSYPFLPQLAPTLLRSGGKCVHDLFRHVFAIDHPTLALPGLLMKVVPFPVAAAQSAVVAEVWANDLDLPAVDEMRAWAERLHGERGEAMQVMPPEKDGSYINEMHDWALRSRNPGKEPPYWDEEKLWERSIFVEAKLRFEKDGCRAITLEDLGFHFAKE
jgi:cation diffusion facilitator CzcD-associated flavoprotein CzcO